MGHDHHHHPRRAAVSAPTLSLLRLSAGRRLIGAAVVLAGLWAMVLSVLG